MKYVAKHYLKSFTLLFLMQPCNSKLSHLTLKLMNANPLEMPVALSLAKKIRTMSPNGRNNSWRSCSLVLSDRLVTRTVAVSSVARIHNSDSDTDNDIKTRCYKYNYTTLRHKQRICAPLYTTIF